MLRIGATRLRVRCTERSLHGDDADRLGQLLQLDGEVDRPAESGEHVRDVAGGVRPLPQVGDEPLLLAAGELVEPEMPKPPDQDLGMGVGLLGRGKLAAVGLIVALHELAHGQTVRSFGLETAVAQGEGDEAVLRFVRIGGVKAALLGLAPIILPDGVVFTPSPAGATPEMVPPVFPLVRHGRASSGWTVTASRKAAICSSVE
jgi:hypothetical protein